MNEIVQGLSNTDVYIDEAVIFSNTWEEHVNHIKAFFEKLSVYGFTLILKNLNLAKQRSSI